MNSNELNKIYQKIKSLQNAVDKPLSSMTPEDTKVRLIPDESVAPSLFKPSQLEPNVYYATQLTIKAVKKEIFMVGEGFEDLENNLVCKDCARTIDSQFWKFCPFCEGSLTE